MNLLICEYKINKNKVHPPKFELKLFLTISEINEFVYKRQQTELDITITNQKLSYYRYIISHQYIKVNQNIGMK